MSRLSATARLVLWDYQRGSLAYDIVCFLILLLLLLTPGAWLADPMTALP